MFRSRAQWKSCVTSRRTLPLESRAAECLWAVEVTSVGPWGRAISVSGEEQLSTCLVTHYDLASQHLWEWSVSLKPRS